MSTNSAHWSVGTSSAIEWNFSSYHWNVFSMSRKEDNFRNSLFQFQSPLTVLYDLLVPVDHLSAFNQLVLGSASWILLSHSKTPFSCFISSYSPWNRVGSLQPQAEFWTEGGMTLRLLLKMQSCLFTSDLQWHVDCTLLYWWVIPECFYWGKNDNHDQKHSLLS